MAGITKSGNTWHLRMRVPKRYQSVEPRNEIHRSLRTRSEHEARIRLPAAEAAVLAELDARLAIRQEHQGGAAGPEAYAGAVALAATRGFTYRSVEELSAGPLEEILDRLKALKPDDGREVAVALLGGAEAPALRLSGLVAEVERIAAYENRFKSEDQMRLWRNPRLRAVANLTAALGEDIEVARITNAEALKHQAWWLKRMTGEGQSADTANKDFSNMGGMLKRYYKDLQVANPPRPYSGVSIIDKTAIPSRKLEIPVPWILEKWFAPGALDGLNAEARDILLISLETGARQSEIKDLPPGAIKLDQNCPYIEVAYTEGEHRREVKNKHSVRQMPLVGVALEAARRHPDGFPRYRGKSTYSAAVNKYLRDKKLLPTPKHTVGGLRHTWEKRLKAIGIDMDDRGELMGHSVASVRGREVYGDDMTLERKLEVGLQIALPVPDYLR